MQQEELPVPERIACRRHAPSFRLPLPQNKARLGVLATLRLRKRKSERVVNLSNADSSARPVAADSSAQPVAADSSAQPVAADSRSDSRAPLTMSSGASPAPSPAVLQRQVPEIRQSSEKAGETASRDRDEPIAIVRRTTKPNEPPDPSERIYKLGDLPRDLRSLVLGTKIPFEELEKHFDIVINILYFNKKVELPRSRKSQRTAAGPRPRALGPDPPKRSSSRKQLPPESNATVPKLIPKTEDELLSTTLNPKKFKFIALSGQGGYGKVWRAKVDLPEFRSAQGKVAIKRLPHVTPKEKKHNLNEMNFLTFCKHPNIVEYYSSVLLKNELLILMEYMEGGTLTEATAGHSFNEPQIAFVAKELLQALRYLHENRLAHRDLKSGNIMMTIKGQIKLIDFGLCVDLSAGPRTEMVGSPFWMAPEMIARQPHSTPVDIWSFAISLLELANKNPPHRNSSFKCMFTFGTVGCPEPLNEPERWSRNFQDFLRQCLTFDQAQRPTTQQLLEHPFLGISTNQKQMAQIIQHIFMHNALSQVVFT